MTQADARRLGQLLGCQVIATDGVVIGQVNDVRLVPNDMVHGVHAELMVEGLVVSDRHAGSFLGYDRRKEQGPALIRWGVRRLHRNARYLPWENVAQIRWSERVVYANSTHLQDLSTAKG
jgi:sporulation protein YlmC with PRC-barrel domain